MLEKKRCGCAGGGLRYHDALRRARAFFGLQRIAVCPLAFAEIPRLPSMTGRERIGRLSEGVDVVQLLDAKDDEAYPTLPSRRGASSISGGARTVLLIALRQRGSAARLHLRIYRQEVRPFFSEKQNRVYCRISPRRR